MANFADYRDWNGRFVGSYDGRPAVLTVNSSLELDRNTSRVSVSLEDRGERWWSGLGTTQNARNHEVEGQRLEPSAGGAPGRQDLHWPRMLIHTWDTNFISGISNWDWKDYGFWFQREGTGGPTNFSRPRFTSWYNLDGRGDHPHESGIGWSSRAPGVAMFDGRPGTLLIRVSAAGPNPQNDCHLNVYFTDFAGNSWRGWKVVRPREHWIHDLELNPTNEGGRRPGSGTVRIQRFFLHTWCIAHASGWSEWEGRRYGFMLKNGT